MAVVVSLSLVPVSYSLLCLFCPNPGNLEISLEISIQNPEDLGDTFTPFNPSTCFHCSLSSFCTKVKHCKLNICMYCPFSIAFLCMKHFLALKKTCFSMFCGVSFNENVAAIIRAKIYICGRRVCACHEEPIACHSSENTTATFFQEP